MCSNFKSVLKTEKKVMNLQKIRANIDILKNNVFCVVLQPDDSQLIISDETSKIKNAKENQRNGKTSEDEINDLKKQLAILTQQVSIVLWIC